MEVGTRSCDHEQISPGLTDVGAGPAIPLPRSKVSQGVKLRYWISKHGTMPLRRSLSPDVGQSRIRNMFPGSLICNVLEAGSLLFTFYFLPSPQYLCIFRLFVSCRSVKSLKLYDMLP